MRIATICVATSAFAVLALSANGASAVEVTTKVPNVHVNPVKPKVYSPNTHGGWDQRGTGGSGGNNAIGSATGGGGSGKAAAGPGDEGPTERAVK